LTGHLPAFAIQDVPDQGGGKGLYIEIITGDAAGKTFRPVVETGQ